MKKTIVMIIAALLMISFVGCNKDINHPTEKQEGFTIYSKKEQIEMFFEHEDMFNDLYEKLSVLEQRRLYVIRKKFGEDFEWHDKEFGWDCKEHLSSDIVYAIENFCAELDCRMILWEQYRLTIQFWDGVGNTEFAYLKETPYGESAYYYTKLSGHWYHCEFPYDRVE